MKKKIIKKILPLTFGLAFVACLGVGVRALNNDKVATAEWSVQEVTESYFLGAEYTLPEGEVTVGDETVVANVALIFPDGSATRAEKTVLNQVGTYTLKYSTTINGKPYGKEVSFVVRGDMITYKSTSTIIGYQTCAYASDPTQEYLTVSLAQGDTITFSQFIDVSNITKDDSLIDLFVSPATRGIADFDQLYYKFTDSQNPDIFLKVRVNRYTKGRSGIAYFLSGGNGQALMGYEAGKDKIHINNEYGAAFSTISFDAKAWNSSQQQNYDIFVDEYYSSLRYDADTRTTYVVDRTDNSTMIIDQDSTLYYEKLWTGFPSGKASLSIWAEGYNSASATFCITDVRGIDVSAYGQKFEETTPPVIQIDSEYETMPEAQLDKMYKIPQATAIDDYSGVCDVDVSVWYNYMSTNAILVDIEDGAFEVTRKGYYSIVYTTSDRYGNEETKVLTIHAGNPIAEITLEPLFTPPTSVVLGDWIELPTPADFNVTGGSGNKTIFITLTNGTDVYEVEESGFRPEKTGKWTVTYTAIDYIGNTGTYSYELDTELPTQPVLVDEIVMPNIFLASQSYIVPAIYANDYRTGELVRGICTVEINDKNGKKTYEADDTFVPEVSKNGDKVIVSFIFDGVILETIEIPTVLSYVDEELQEQNYFYGNGFEAETTTDGLKITAKQSESEWMFANSLVAEGLSTQLVGEAGNTNYKGYEMTLVDTINPEISIRAKVIKNGKLALFSVYGTDTVLELHTNLDEEILELGYEDNAFYANGTPINVLKTIDGKPFNGFTSTKVYVKVKLISAEVGSAYKVVSINGAPFTGETMDLAPPSITILGDYGGSYALNSEYVVNAAVAGDVLSPNVYFTMTVTTPSGQIAKDVNGEELYEVDPSVPYTILLSEYGKYLVTYYAEDEAESTERNVGINVLDMEAPKITFDGKFQTLAKVGDVLVIPNFTVSDNVTKEDKLLVMKYVVNPYGAVITLKDGNSIKVDHAGIYEFRIMVVDKIGNVKLIQAYVTVTE